MEGEPQAVQQVQQGTSAVRLMSTLNAFAASQGKHSLKSQGILSHVSKMKQYIQNDLELEKKQTYTRVSGLF